jgi:hypothetical protein
VLAIDSRLILAGQIPKVPLNMFEKGFLLPKQRSIYKAPVTFEWENRRVQLRDLF